MHSLQIPVYQATFDSYKKEAVNEKELFSFSWDQSVLDNWGNPIVENYKDVFTYETIVVDVVLNKDEFNIDEKIYEKVLLTLNNDLEIRNKLISWKFKLDNHLLSVVIYQLKHHHSLLKAQDLFSSF